MEDVYHHIGSAVQQDNVPTHQYIGALGRRWPKSPFQVHRNGLQLFLESWWQGAATHQLLLKSGR